VPLSPAFQIVSFADLPGWIADDQSGAFDAFRRSAMHALSKPYRSGSLGVDSSSFAEAYEAARATKSLTHAEAKAFFEIHFVPARIVPEDADAGLVTGFYEPEVEASPVRTERFCVPLLSRPADLIDIDDENRPDGMDPYLAFARRTEAGLVEYFDRAAIETGALAGQGLEIAWLESKVDAFFIHVQGAARLHMADGSPLRRVTYAAKSGQRFSGPGKILADLGEIPLNQVTMQSIRAWFARNPDRVDEILRQNRSYIFFREAPVDDPALRSSGLRGDVRGVSDPSGQPDVLGRAVKRHRSHEEVGDRLGFGRSGFLPCHGGDPNHGARRDAFPSPSRLHAFPSPIRRNGSKG
jgi:membrane-bound lytic murein transglycosylase A